MSKSSKNTTKKVNDLLISKLEKKAIKDSLKSELKLEKSQAGTLRTLKRLNSQANDPFLTDFMKTLVNDIDSFYSAIQLGYTDSMNAKLKIAESGKPVQVTRYRVTYKGLKKSGLKSKKAVEDFIQSEKLTANTTVETEDYKVNKSSTFTPLQMLDNLIRVENKVREMLSISFHETEIFTPVMIYKAYSKRIPQAVKEISEKIAA